MSPHIDLTKQNLIDIFSSNKNPISDKEMRLLAEAELKSLDFPTKKTEIWKHTDIKPILKHRFSLPKKMDVDQEYIDNLTIHSMNSEKLVFVNGFYSPEKSTIQERENLIVIPMTEAKEKHQETLKKYLSKSKVYKENVFTALNVAYADNGYFILIPKNSKSPNPIHILNFNDGDNQKIVTQSRNLIVAESGAEIEIINSYHSLTSDYTLTNAITEIFAEENAKIDYYLFQGQGNDAYQIHNTQITQAKYSRVDANTTTLCGAIVRNDLKVNLEDENCETNLAGLYLPDKEQHFDNSILINHLKPHCTSSQLYRGIIDNKAEAVFLGKVYVAPDAQKTDASQSNKTVLLSDHAKSHSQPQLEIYADDVLCAHGTTTGQIDKEAIFYLQTRGISEKQAKTLMLGAFVGEVVETIKLEPYKNFVNYLVNKRLLGEDVTGLCAIKICPSC